ncbi:hypothetical protein [Streptacidiphilus anmyonensis]|uniref:hypothetical protein n=1 Tax=Streptacidiphilus anmyonensis TaxID=405782 RepID=UPI0005A674A3|nr:hypothetical protein [Streptacidiphilus anmyonensis]
MPETLDDDRPAASSPLSRRRLIQNATATGAATVAAGFALNAGLAGVAAAAPRTDAADPETAREATRPTPEHAPAPSGDEPFVVRVVDARTGELDIFHGHQHHRVRDQKLVAALLRAAR